MMKIFIATAGGLLALLAAAPAHADASQDAYVRELQQAGIPGASDQVLTNGILMCEAMRTEHLDTLTVANLSAPRAGIPVTQAAFEVGAAIRWLCPEQHWQIQELGQADPSVPGVTAAIAGYAG